MDGLCETEVDDLYSTRKCEFTVTKAGPLMVGRSEACVTDGILEA